MRTHAPASWNLSAPENTLEPDRQRFLPLAFIIGGNLVPLIGVLAWGWDVFSIFVLYWLENIVIGILMIVRIVIASATDIAGFFGGLFLAAFFTFHYGLFMLGHGVFVFSLFGAGAIDTQEFLPDFIGALNDAQIKGFGYALIGIIIAEAFQNFRPRPPEQDQSLSFIVGPYGRLIILHVTLIFGGMLTLSLGEPVWALVMLIALKIGFEVAVFVVGEKNIPIGKAFHGVFRRKG